PLRQKIGPLDVGASGVIFSSFSNDQNWLAIDYTNVHLPTKANPAARPPANGLMLFALPSREKQLEIANAETGPAISADGRFLAVGFKDGMIQMCDITAKKEVFRWHYPGGQPLAQLIFTPKGHLVVNNGQSLQQLDLGLLRQQLAEIGVGW